MSGKRPNASKTLPNVAARRIIRHALGAGSCRRGVVVDMRLFRVLGFFVVLAVIVAVRQFAVVVLVRMPVRSVFEVSGDSAHAALVVVRHVVVIVRARPRQVCVLR